MSIDLQSKLTPLPRLYKEITLDVGGEAVHLIIRRPPRTVMAMLLSEARKAGELDEQDKPKDGGCAMRLMARMAASVLYAPDGVRPLYDRKNPEVIENLVENAEWLLDIQEDVVGALGANGAVVERIQGNSEATQT
ncbi:hypothetical protein [Vitiosangium sp. GDMCC 1.1324]|uniref:hypothetical protein n=1 Tax=Vitiosangium sp. (strain GDMCC 1.1324) TaxID=2138576 RepID=UPI000D368A64|nr:hypothetical protein [Vitiosangium sp. GDMCC 1.1324]PTL79089.1 hypothetical protein DAT35_36380 [Vitiosangium sp. GDMCC 1.1324]